jgi:histidine triad (HIT) family protein
MTADVFCKIINKEWPAEVVMEEKEWLAIKDIHPQAPVHILIFSKKHLEGLGSVQAEDEQLLGKLLLAVQRVAEQSGLSQRGYRVIINSGADGGQAVPHLHIHLLGGKILGPKMVK